MAHEQLKILYDQVAELTRPKCAQCNVPHGCCNKDMCEQVYADAHEFFGVTLQKTDHERLPFMGPNGCVVPPHLRPICSVHVCEKHLWDPAFADKYFKLREVISNLDTRYGI